MASNRLAADQHEVRQVQVAMAASHVALPAAPRQHFLRARECVPARGVERIGLVRSEAGGAEDRGVARDDDGNRVDPGRGGYGRRHRVRCGNRVGDVAGEVRGERSGLCDVIERQPLVETLHVHRPFDRHAVAADDERPIVAARDRHHPAVDVRREGAVDPQFLVAGLFSLCQRRIIEKREADRTLDLQCARAGEKH
jgi:hypothetical protein